MLAVILIDNNIEMRLSFRIILIFALVAGLIVPFVPAFTVIQMFYLLVPFAIIIFVTLIYLILSFLIKGLNSRKALFIFLLLPIFLLAQLVSGFGVDKLQRLRSKRIINEIHQIERETGIIPEQFNIPMGIEYRRLEDGGTFEISYSRGFMVTEKYNSIEMSWKSYGWND